MPRDVKIQLPNAWSCRPYQDDLWRYLNNGGTRAVAVWHRRAGKDSLGIHWTSVAAVKRVGTYWHMLPTLRQGRLVVWDGITKDGTKVLDAWPRELVESRRNDEMKLTLKNGSVWQVVGSDNYNSLVGANPVGVVMSEYSLADPAAWDFIRPILAENGGWAVFLYTPRGPNHGQELFDMASREDNWFAEKLTVEDTDAIPLQAVEEERAAGMSDEMIRQEFYCSFDAPMIGAYYGRQMSEAQDEGRIGHVPHDPAVKVETWWDLGFKDAMAIWFVQRVGQEIRLIDYYENSGEMLSHYVGILDEKMLPKERGGRGFSYSDHYLPHDARVEELQTGKSRVQALNELGVSVEIVPDHGVDAGIEVARKLLGRCWFDLTHCQRGIDCLRSYRKNWDDRRKVFHSKPVHDWASHGADAFRYGAMVEIQQNSQSTGRPRGRAVASGWMGA